MFHPLPITLKRRVIMIPLLSFVMLLPSSVIVGQTLSSQDPAFQVTDFRLGPLLFANLRIAQITRSNTGPRQQRMKVVATGGRVTLGDNSQIVMEERVKRLDLTLIVDSRTKPAVLTASAGNVAIDLYAVPKGIS